MQTGKRRESMPRTCGAILGSSLPARRGAWILAFLAAVVALTGFALPRPQTPAPARSTAAANPASQSVSQASVNPQPKPLDTEAAQKNPDAAGSAHNRQIAADSAKLLKLATDLKAEVDKTNKDTLSLKVIRKADEIEHFAHNVREKVKPAVGANEGGRR